MAFPAGSGHKKAGLTRITLTKYGGIAAEEWNNRELLPLVKELGHEQSGWRRFGGLGRSVPIPPTTAAAFFEEDVKKTPNR